MTDKNKKKKMEWEEAPAEPDAGGQADNAAAETPAQDGAEMVTIPLTEYASQLEALDDLKKKADDFSEGWQRERAEFDNYRKRAARNDEMHRQDSRMDILRKYLDIHDDIDLAVRKMPENVKNEGWANGILLIQQKLANLLKGEGLEPISAEDGVFDPAVHEAISLEEHAEFESGKIIETVQQGYKLGERVVRPSRVRVAK